MAVRLLTFLTSRHNDLTNRHKLLTSQHKDLTSRYKYLTSDSRNMPPQSTYARWFWFTINWVLNCQYGALICVLMSFGIEFYSKYSVKKQYYFANSQRNIIVLCNRWYIKSIWIYPQMPGKTSKKYRIH